jgi:hypothetical protein
MNHPALIIDQVSHGVLFRGKQGVPFVNVGRIIKKEADGTGLSDCNVACQEKYCQLEYSEKSELIHGFALS